MKPAVLWGAAAAAVMAALAFNTAYVVRQTQQAVVLRLGRPARVETAPGLYAKWPLAEAAIRLDMRNRTVEANGLSLATADRGRLALDAYLHYRVADPRRFYLVLGDVRAADQRLRDLLAASVQRTLGADTAAAVVTTDQDRLMRPALEDLRRRATEARLGVEIVDAGLRRTGLPAAEVEAVYRRMQAEGAQQAAQIRADGEQRKAGIIADADRQAAGIHGDAEAQALRINGEGDARRIAVLGAAYGKDPAFARFFRQMEAYQNALAQGDTTLVLSPDNAFLRDFAKGPSGK